MTREVRVLAPNEYGIFEEEEVPLAAISLPNQQTPLAGPSYVVVQDDTLWRIAQKVLGDKNRWPELYDLNKETIGPNPDRIYIGQVLITAEP